MEEVWGCGAAGSALAWHARGQGFESPQLHQTNNDRLYGGLYSFMSPTDSGGAKRRLPSAPPNE